MTPEAAKDRLRLMVAADSDPQLSGTELDQLIGLAQRPDCHGRTPDDPDWEPTWALGSAASEGWRWKAGRVADRVDFSADGTRVSRSQLAAHCLRMSDVYQGRALATVVLTPSGANVQTAPAVPTGWLPRFPGDQGPVPSGPPYASPHALPGAGSRGDNTA